MNTPLQERENLQRSLENLDGPLVRSQDRCRTYSDLLHQLKMLSSQVQLTVNAHSDFLHCRLPVISASPDQQPFLTLVANHSGVCHPGLY